MDSDKHTTITYFNGEFLSLLMPSVKFGNTFEVLDGLFRLIAQS